MALRTAVFALAGLTLLAAPRAAAHTDPHSVFSDADCDTVACRPAGTADLGTRDRHTVSAPVPKSPYVTKDGTIVIYPGEKLLFDFPQAGDTPGLPHYLANPTGSETNTLSVEFTQAKDGNPAMLMLRQTTSHTIKVDATMTVLEDGRVMATHTSTCPLWPNVMGNEMWQQPLGALLIDNVRYLPPSTTMSCE